MSGDHNHKGNVLRGEMMTDKDEDEHYIVGFHFEYASPKGAKVSFSIDPSPTQPSAWAALAEAIKTGEPYEISTCQCNGDVSIGHAHGEIVFRTHRTGAGGDGDLEVTLPAADCLAAIEKCAQAFANHDPSPSSS